VKTWGFPQKNRPVSTSAIIADQPFGNNEPTPSIEADFDRFFPQDLRHSRCAIESLETYTEVVLSAPAFIVHSSMAIATTSLPNTRRATPRACVSRRDRLVWILRLLVGVLILKVTAGIVWEYRNYLPADFDSLFLSGREAYFWEGYHWAFYTHILAGPPTLLFGMLLLNQRFLRRFPQWHRMLGRVQVICVLLLLTPSGLWMAWYADAGPIAGVGFAALAVATATCIILGWRTAVGRRFVEHRRWMLRCYILLCSAVVLRLLGGMALLAGSTADWPYQLAAWVSWLVPLGIYEATRWLKRRSPGRSDLFDRLPTINGDQRRTLFG
jgi:hypothetical protein